MIPDRLCDEDCNQCGLMRSPNKRQLDVALNAAHRLFGDRLYQVIEAACPNLTVCYDCCIDDFCHLPGCLVDQAAGRLMLRLLRGDQAAAPRPHNIEG